MRLSGQEVEMEGRERLPGSRLNLGLSLSSQAKTKIGRDMLGENKGLKLGTSTLQVGFGKQRSNRAGTTLPSRENIIKDTRGIGRPPGRSYT